MEQNTQFSRCYRRPLSLLAWTMAKTIFDYYVRPVLKGFHFTLTAITINKNGRHLKLNDSIARASANFLKGAGGGRKQKTFRQFHLKWSNGI